MGVALTYNTIFCEAGLELPNRPPTTAHVEGARKVVVALGGTITHACKHASIPAIPGRS
jgi:hypothetical protein